MKTKINLPSGKASFLRLLVVTAAFLLTLTFPNKARAQNLPVLHCINDSGQDYDSVLNSNGVFITSFKATNDLTVKRLASDPLSAVVQDIFNGGTTVNNPWYITEFVGAASNGTGDGVAGHIKL